jgi:hypothetical protein
MIWRKLTPEEESLLFELLSRVGQLGHGPDTELFVQGSFFVGATDKQTKQGPDTGPSAPSSQPHADGEHYLKIVGKADYSGVPFRWQTLELLVEYGFMHKSSKVGNYRLLQDAWEYRDWQRLPRPFRFLKAQWAMSRNEVRAAVISAIVSLAISLVARLL